MEQQEPLPVWKKACERNEKLIFAIGNAPTALIHLYELSKTEESVGARESVYRSAL